MQKGLIIVHTGNGKGKTTAALGLLMRAAGQNFKCVMLQFIKRKGSHYGEHMSAAKLGIELLSLGDGFTWDTKNPEQDRRTAAEAWKICAEKINSGVYDLVVLDEINVALSLGMLDVENVAEVLRQKSPELHVVLTGRDAPEAIIEIADLVTEMREIKHPFNQGIYAQRGIEF